MSAIVALCALLATAVLYLILSYAPQTLAFVLPEAWRNTLGDQVEQTVASHARLCATSNDNIPLGDLRDRLAEGNPDSPAFSLKVYDLKIINAFTLPGGRIVLTRDLIDAAKTPEELAGVVAHEVGHVYHRHPEAQLVRSMGIELLLRIASGGGDTISGFAGLLAILRYSRDAEREADSYALNALANAAIDPMGLKRFFEAMQKLEGGRSKPGGGGLFGAMNDILSTHPVTAERIDDIKPLPAGTVARPALSAVEWASLKKVCG
jgi:predicted Zn-dependent protease